tara:strand:- start:646 stop:969 length:324 start_codon:yes stop_codon:yes gene_type:complete
LFIWQRYILVIHFRQYGCLCISAVYDGIGAVYDGIGAVCDGIGAVYDGIGAVYDGIGAVYDGIRAVYDGIGAVYGGYCLYLPFSSFLGNVIHLTFAIHLLIFVDFRH